MPVAAYSWGSKLVSETSQVLFAGALSRCILDSGLVNLTFCSQLKIWFVSEFYEWYLTSLIHIRCCPWNGISRIAYKLSFITHLAIWDVKVVDLWLAEFLNQRSRWCTLIPYLKFLWECMHYCLEYYSENKPCLLLIHLCYRRIIFNGWRCII